MSVDYSGLLSELLVLWHDIAARQVLGDDVESELVDDDVLLRLAEGLSPEDVQLYYQLTLLARRDLDLAPDHRTGFEMAMLRLIAFKPVPADGARQTPTTAAARVAPAAAPLRDGRGAPAAAPVRDAAVAAPPSSVREPRAAPATAVREMPVAASAPVREAVVAPVADYGWFDLVERAPLRGPSRELAAQLKPIEGAGTRWKLALAPNLDSLNSPFARKGLEEALRAVVGADCSLEIVLRAQDGETLAERSARARADQVRGAEQELMADPGLQALVGEFGARVVPGSLQVD